MLFLRWTRSLEDSRYVTVNGVLYAFACSYYLFCLLIAPFLFLLQSARAYPFSGSTFFLFAITFFQWRLLLWPCFRRDLWWRLSIVSFVLLAVAFWVLRTLARGAVWLSGPQVDRFTSNAVPLSWIGGIFIIALCPSDVWLHCNPASFQQRAVAVLAP